VYSKLHLRPLVKKGAELLDKAVPDWAMKVNLKKLQMHLCARCVLGQIFWKDDRTPAFLHGYDEGIRKLGLTFKEAERWGFTLAGVDHFDKAREVGWENLKALWVDEIIKRTT